MIEAIQCLFGIEVVLTPFEGKRIFEGAMPAVMMMKEIDKIEQIGGVERPVLEGHHFF